MLRRFTGSGNNNLALLMSKLKSREEEIFNLLTQATATNKLLWNSQYVGIGMRNHVSNIFDKVGISNKLHVEFDLICDDLK